MLPNVGVNTACKCVKDAINVRLYFLSIFNDGCLGSQQSLQVIAVPPVFVGDEMQVTIAQGVHALNFSASPLCVPILNHHVFQMIFGLSIPVSEESRLF